MQTAALTGEPDPASTIRSPSGTVCSVTFLHQPFSERPRVLYSLNITLTYPSCLADEHLYQVMGIGILPLQSNSTSWLVLLLIFCRPKQSIKENKSFVVPYTQIGKVTCIYCRTNQGRRQDPKCECLGCSISLWDILFPLEKFPAP